MPPLIVGIRFAKVGKVYHFDATSFPMVKPGDFAVVETTRGRQLGEVTSKIKNPPPPPDGKWKPIQRLATPRDLVMRQVWQKKETEAVENCSARAADLDLLNVKIIAAEFSFDGSRLTILYSTEAEEKLDLRILRRAIQRIYPQSQVELHQIGPRDTAKMFGGMGACNLANRCCAQFLTDFCPVSIKMAKDQDISLTPSEITGMCGRLRCCMVYEYGSYTQARQALPKRGKHVVTPKGEGKVVEVFPMKDTIRVDLGEEGFQEFPREDIQPWDEIETQRRKSNPGAC